MNCNDAQFFALNAAAREAVTRRTFLRQSGGGIGPGGAVTLGFRAADAMVFPAA